MKFTSVIYKPALSLIAALALSIQLGAQSQPRYTITDLGPPDNPFSQACALNDYGIVAGVETASDGSQNAVAWDWGTRIDIGKPGLGGSNSTAGGINQFGQIIGAAETAAKDPHNENFCGFGTGQQCLAFLWDFGVMVPRPTLGGTNSTFGAINNFGEIAGIAENGHHDPNCPSTAAVNGTGPLFFDFEAVVWGPLPHQIRELPPLPGDTVGMAFAINDSSQVVGALGTCANTVLPGFATAPHAVLWERDGIAHSLPNLGGLAPDTTVLGVGNVAEAINNHGIIAGQSTLPNNKVWHPVLWENDKISDLGVLPGDLVGAALNINDRGEVVGASISAPGPSSGNPRAFLWRNGVMTDLNTLIPANSPLYLLTAFAINDSGEIVGFGVNEDGDLHAFLAKPCPENSRTCDDASAPVAKRNVTLSERARTMLLQYWLRRH